MMGKVDNIELQADQRADRKTFLIILVFALLSWIILSVTKQSPPDEYGRNIGLGPWVSEGTSHLAMVISIAVLPFLLSKVPMIRPFTLQKILTYLAGFVAFSALHIIVMVLLRTILYPGLFDRVYAFGILNPDVWTYEMSKDFYTFALVVVAFIFGRHLEQLKMELAADQDDARVNHRLSLKSGGRVIYLGANEVIRANAAANYVEVRTKDKIHLARMTLSRLADLLAESGDEHMRVHRSHLVKKSAVREVVPTGEGDAKLILTNDDTVPVSRKYRAALESGLSGAS